MQNNRHLIARTSVALAVLGILSASAPVTVWAALPAAERTNSSSDLSVAEIIVTAQRRSENMQDVPIAVSATDAPKLEAFGITDLGDLKSLVPSLDIENGNGYLLLHLRGVGSASLGAGIENPISLYVDGVYYANQTIGLAGFNNIDRVEVLYGPQGTLFGRNATGGLVQVITAEPTQDFKLRLDGQYSNYQATEGSAYLSGGLAPNLAADVAIRASRSGQGWGTNLFNGEDVYRNIRDVAVRSKWVYAPGPLKLTLIGDYSETTNSLGGGTLFRGTALAPGVPPASYSNPWDDNTDVQPVIREKNGGVSLKAEASLPGVTISNLSSWRNSKYFNALDDDGSPLPLTGVVIRQNDWQASDELQFTSNSPGKLKWVGGLFYFHENGATIPTDVVFSSNPVFNPIFPLQTLQGYSDVRTDSAAAFGQGTLAVTDRLNLTVGARYTWEQKQLEASQDFILAVPGNPIVPVLAVPNTGVVNKDPTFRLAVDYKPTDDVLTYASINTGFKSGGFNATVPTDPAYKPEKLTAYEVGEKAELLQRRLRINSAIFYYDYKDIQVDKPEATGDGIINGARAKLYGADLEVTAILVQDLELSGGASLLHAKFGSFENAPISTPLGGIPVVTGSASGNALPYAPSSTINLGLRHILHLGDNKLESNLLVYHSANYYFEPDNALRQSAYTKLNGSVKLVTVDDHFSVGLYAKNITNQAIPSSGLTIPGGQHLQIMSPPRTYGVMLSYRY